MGEKYAKWFIKFRAKFIQAYTRTNINKIERH